MNEDRYESRSASSVSTSHPGCPGNSSRPRTYMFRFSSRTRGGTVSRRRHSLNMTSLPTRPLPSLNGWTRSNIQWHIAMRTGSSDRPAYAAYTRSIIPGTSPAGTVLTMATPMRCTIALSLVLYPPTLNPGSPSCDVPRFSRARRRHT